MKRLLFLIFLFTKLPAESAVIINGPCPSDITSDAVIAAGATTPAPPFTACDPPQDSIGKQILYNGRVWRNLYQHIDGTQFLLSPDFLHGSVTMNGTTFNSSEVMLKLDLINDELLLLTDKGSTLQLNKQMVDRFTLSNDGKQLLFRNLEADSLSDLKGYVYVIHDGKTALYVKYKKEIRLRDGPGDRDTFIQTQRIYLVKDGISHQVRNRKNIVRLLKDRKAEVKDFVRTNRVHFSANNPGSVAPLLEYYDKL